MAGGLLLGAILLAVVAAAGAWASGFRWFTVETASMGGSAPVGTLVVTAPARLDGLPLGTVIAFHPPTAPREVYTHRIVAVRGDGVLTRGDINGATDGWRLQQRDLIGRAVVLLPGVGFLLRALPLLLAGNAVIRLATSRLRAPAQRAALRTIGFSLVACLPAFLQHPFIRIEVLTTQAVAGGIRASVVSTGLLPVRVTAGTGQHLTLRDGQVGSLVLPVREEGYRLASALQLTPPEWALLLGLCALPLVWNLVVGLPDEPREQRP